MTVLHMNLSGQVISFLMVATDHLTGATGQAPTVRFSKNGATAFATATQAVTEMQFGWYKLTLATGNVDTEGELAIHATATKADDTDEKHQVTPGLWANLMRVATTTVPAPNQAGRPLVDLTHIHGATATTGAAHFGVSVYSWATATGTVPTPNQPGRPLVDLTHIHGATATTGTAHIGVNIVSMATDSIVANTLATSGVDKIADQVWDEAMSGHTSTGSAGDYLDRIKTSATDIQTRLPAALVGGRMDSSIGNVQSAAITATGFAAGAFSASGLATGAADKIADQVWDEVLSGHTTTDTTGDYLARAVAAGATASDIWTRALPGAYATATNSAGYLVGTFIDATISSRSTATQAPTAVENADALLNRDMSAVSDTNARSPLNALRFLRNKWTLATTGALTVFKENDSTTAWLATATGDSAATPITGVDPA